MENFTSDSWHDIKLVSFDVDGTLYDQRKLRILMMREILIEILRKRTIKFVRILKVYRELRENHICFSDNFEQVLISKTATLIGCSEKEVHDTVIEWIHRRPLRHLFKCRYAGIFELFSHIKRQGKKIGIFSDYPAEAKILALGLTADYIACAGDDDTPRLKPDPQGLLNLMNRSGTKPDNTLLIGDRPERDGLAAHAAGSRILLRSTKKYRDYQTFVNYKDPIFSIN